MTGNNCLLDTCVIVDVFRKKYSGKKLDAFQSVYVSSVTIGELYFGAYRSSNPHEKFNEISGFVQNCVVITVDQITASIYGTIKNELKLKGKPIPENDIWIASCAIQHKLPLYTFDLHFKEIDSISLINL